ncbi:MAG: glycolate oxidase [Solirubrobacteraceae bacterium]
MSATLSSELAGLLETDAATITDRVPASYLSDATEARGLRGHADAVVFPTSAEDVARVMAWCYEHGVAITPRGGGTGYAGGAVPDGGVVLCLGRMRRVRSLEPLLWRAEVEAGLPTADVQRLARENGLYFPPDPGAAEQSQIGGNAATNAGGPHAFKYGVTGAWTTGVEAVVPPGRVVRFGGAVRKDVAGYDLRSLLIGSEGTLGIITALNLRFIPPPEHRYPVLACFAGARAGAAAIEACLASGVVPAALEYLDNDAVNLAGATCPVAIPRSCFVVIAEADGSGAEASEGREALIEVLCEGAVELHAPKDAREIDALWRWRDGVGLAADAALGGKVSEDIAVPIDRLADAIEETRNIGRRHRLATCSWGHAGDGNLHSTFLFARADAEARERANTAAEDLFALAAALGGTVSGEHGVGVVKAGQLSRQWNPVATGLHDGVKALFDPEGLLNPGKKVSR